MARKKLEYPGSIVAANPTSHLECPWNDHGIICGKRGSLSDSLNGAGPWFCVEHYWQLKGRIGVVDDRHHGPGKAPCNYPGCTSKGVAGKNPFYCLVHYGYRTTPSYRERWYAERGLTYDPPKPGNLSGLPNRQLGPRQREPGEDPIEEAA